MILTARPYREVVAELSDEDFVAEGGTMLWANKEEFFTMWEKKFCRRDFPCSVIKFEFVPIGEKFTGENLL